MRTFFSQKKIQNGIILSKRITQRMALVYKAKMRQYVVFVTHHLNHFWFLHSPRGKKSHKNLGSDEFFSKFYQ